MTPKRGFTIFILGKFNFSENLATIWKSLINDQILPLCQKHHILHIDNQLKSKTSQDTAVNQNTQSNNEHELS